MNPDCVFCKILSGQIPAEKILDTTDVIAFLDIGPIVKGHLLVIPRMHHEHLCDLPPEVLHRVSDAVQAMVRACRTGLKADGVNVFQANGAAAGQVVPHVHFHVIPRFNDDGHRWNWASGKYRDAGEMSQMGERLRAAAR
jgi:histidine triad (HIT) family protein